MPSQLRGTAVLAIRVIALILAIIVVTSLATGWLYWLRAGVAGWPGPRVADALPLDELPGRDGVPLAVYLTVFAVAGLVLGLAARALRLDRLTAGLSLAAGTGLWLLAVDTLCLFVVRQVPAGTALQAAGRLQPVYLAAALAGAGGALLGRDARPGGGLTPRLLASLVAAGGLIDLLSALAPHSGRTLGLLAGFGPYAVFPATHVLLVPVGVLLLITSRGLRRRSRPAWRLAAGLLSLSVLLHLLRGPHYAAAVVTGLVTVALIARRDDYPFRGDPAARPSAALRLLGIFGFTLGYGIVALWAYQTAADLPFSPTTALLDTLRAMGGQLPSEADFLPGEIADWFPLSVMSVIAVGVIWAAAVWVRPGGSACSRIRGTASRRQTSCAGGAATRWRPSPCGRTRNGSSPGRPSSPTGWSAASPWSAVTRSGRPEARGWPCGASWPTRRPAAGAPLSWARRTGCSPPTGSWGCTRSTTATRRSSAPASSAWTGAQCGRSGRLCTGWNGRDSAPRSCWPVT